MRVSSDDVFDGSRIKLDDMIHWCSVATFFSGMRFVYVESFLVIVINPHCVDCLG